MAAFLPSDTNDRAAFLDRWFTILSNPRITARTIQLEDVAVGHVVSYPEGDQLHVGYWIGKRYWGRGLATQGLALLLEALGPRELHACTASENLASARVLQKNGFTQSGTRIAYAAALDREITELLWVRDAKAESSPPPEPR